MLRTLTEEESSKLLDESWNLLKMKKYSLINDGYKTHYLVLSYNEKNDEFSMIKIGEPQLELIAKNSLFGPVWHRRKSDFKVINVLT